MDSFNTFMFSEPCGMGELFSLVATKRRLPESLVQVFMKQICDGVRYIFILWGMFYITREVSSHQAHHHPSTNIDVVAFG